MKACRILFAAALVVFIIGTGPGTGPFSGRTHGPLQAGL
jgi:hypothetical protein